jgi:mRNA-degrading endonuclease RelE of RelBE toxin-antitoxin system
MEVEYLVTIKRKVARRLDRLPKNVYERFLVLVKVLRSTGPTGPHEWPHYGKLAGRGNEYHCHLPQYHVACWRHDKGTITIEVIYVGSHEGAPC